MYNIGFRAHDYGVYDSPEKLAEAIGKIIPDAPIQLAPFKSFPSLGNSVLTPGFAVSCKPVLNIAILGSYFNPVHPNLEERRLGLDRFKTCLSLANAFGAYAVGTETGSLDPDCGYHPDTSRPEVLDTFWRTMDEMMETAIKCNARVAIEPVSTNHTISSIERMDAMIRRYSSDNLSIILDIANIAPLTGIREKDGTALQKPSRAAIISFLDDFTSVAGRRLAAVHVKNYALDGKGAKICDLPADEGAVDWTVVMDYLERKYSRIPFLIEGPLNDRDRFFNKLNE